IVTAWDREVYSALEQARPGDFYFKSAKSLMRYNCNARTADMLMKVYYAEDGSEITTITASYYGKPNYVIPGTEGEQKFEHACQYKKPEEKKLAAVTRKKSGKSKEADKTADMSAKKATSGDKARAIAPENPVKAHPRSLPIRKPSGTLPEPVADASKG
ncbi:MAG: surface-adhesin E family protein, partial [Sulfuricella sp.]